VAVVRGLSETFDGGQNQGVVKTTGATGSLAYSFTPSLSGLASVAYHQNEFTGVGGTPTTTAVGTSPTRTERVLVGSIGLTFQIVRWLSTGLHYSYSRTTSNDVDGEIRENRVRASLNFIF